MAGWIALLQRVSQEISRVKCLVDEEQRERLAVMTERNALVINIQSKLRLLRKGIPPPCSSSDDDDDLVAAANKKTEQKKTAEGMSAAAKLNKHRVVVERRQGDWDSYEVKCRELRRAFEKTEDPRVLDQISGLPIPAAKKAAAFRSMVAAAGSQPIVPAADDTRHEEDMHTCKDRVAVALVSHSAIVEVPPTNTATLIHSLRLNDVQVLRDEGFARAAVLMEERSNRTALQKQWSISLIEGDSEMRASAWNRECYAKELEERENNRRLDSEKTHQSEQDQAAQRYRTLASEQTQRIFIKKMLRERRVAMQVEEQNTREDIVRLWSRSLDIVVTMNFHRLMEFVPEEEIHRRASIMKNEQQEFHVFAIGLKKFLQRRYELEAQAPAVYEELFETETFFIRRHIELYHKQVEEEELEQRRRDILRKAYEAEELERLKLEGLYGASPLTLRPGFGADGNRLVLKQSDELRFVLRTHPPAAIQESVRKASRMNQENNSLFMALDPRYIKVNKSGAAAAASPEAMTTSSLAEVAVASPPPEPHQDVVVSWNDTATSA